MLPSIFLLHLVASLGLEGQLSEGTPQLTSSSGLLELSGEQCPGILTLTCDARNFGTTGIIDWYAGDDDRLARFDISGKHNFPFITSTSPDILNVTIELTSASRHNNQFDFINYTLTARMDEFLTLMGQNITCGSLIERSPSFRIDNFSVVDASMNKETNWNVTYQIEYNKNNFEITVIWNERFMKCASMIRYTATLLYNSENVTKYLSNEECNGTSCSLSFSVTVYPARDAALLLYADGETISTITVTHYISEGDTVNIQVKSWTEILLSIPFAFIGGIIITSIVFSCVLCGCRKCRESKSPEENVKIKEKQDIAMTHNRLYAKSGARYVGQASVTMTENDLYESLQI